MQKSPKKNRAHNNLGNALFPDSLEIAIDVYQEALRIAPNDPVVHYNLGRALVAKGAYDQAISHYRDASRYLTDALTYLKSERDKRKTVKHLELTLVDLGAVQVLQGDTASAIESFGRAIELNPDSAMAHYNLGVAYAKERKAELSLAHLNKANDLDPIGFPQRYTAMPLPDIHYSTSP